MDKAYIRENNILERYIIGDLNANEQLEVEKALSKFPELQKELIDKASSFESMAFENAIEAPSHVKSDLMKSMRSNSEPKTVSIAQNKPIRSYLNIAASVAILLSISTVYLLTQLNATKQQLEVVETENTELNNNINSLNNFLEETNKWYELVNNPNVNKYILEGNELMPDAKVISYVNNIDQSVVINTAYLPELDADHDYQMWADVEGEMINMGVIDTKSEMLAMTYINDAESLNITIEPAGGNDHPTVSRLITNIYL